MASGRRYYWLKLQKDFFKRHDVQVVEAMPNGKDYVLFYLKLLCEATTHDGNLRFSESIPYNEDMLSTITRTNVDIVRSAIKIFTELGMMEMLDDGTIFMNEIEKMLGFETDWARRKREQRLLENRSKEDKSMDNILQMSNTCPTRVHEEWTISQNVHEEKEKEKEIEIEKDIKENNKRKVNQRFTPPTIEEAKSYCEERKNNVDVNRFINYYESNGWKVGRNQMKDWKAAIRTWEKNDEKPKTRITKFDV